MQLKIQRSQRTGGLSSKVIFCIDARAYLTADEQASVSRYRLGSQVIYNSQAARKHLDAAKEAGAEGGAGGLTRFVGSMVLASMHLNITIDSLQKGQHVECKDLEEMLAAEEGLMNACTNLQGYLRTAATFDGREVVIDFSQPEPVAVSTAPRVALQSSAPLTPPVVLAVTPPSTSNVSAPPNLVSSPAPPAPAYQHAGGSSYAANTNLPTVGDLWGNLTPEKQFYVAMGSALLLLIVMYFVL